MLFLYILNRYGDILDFTICNRRHLSILKHIAKQGCIDLRCNEEIGINMLIKFCLFGGSRPTWKFLTHGDVTITGVKGLQILSHTRRSWTVATCTCNRLAKELSLPFLRSLICRGQDWLKHKKHNLPLCEIKTLTDCATTAAHDYWMNTNYLLNTKK